MLALAAPPRGRETIRMVYSSPRGGREGALGELEGGLREQKGAFGDFQKLILGLTEPLLWIQLVAEGSASTWRAFGVAMAKVRRVNVEGSAFH